MGTVMRTRWTLGQVRVQSLPANDAAAGAFPRRREIHPVVGVHLRDRFRVTPRGPHRVVGIPADDVLPVRLSREYPHGLLSLPDLGLIDLAVHPDSAVLV